MELDKFRTLDELTQNDVRMNFSRTKDQADATRRVVFDAQLERRHTGRVLDRKRREEL